MKKTALAAILLSLVLALTGCGLGGAPDGAGVKADDYSFAQAQESDRYSDFDLSETWDNTATVVSFDKDKIEVNGTGAEDAGGDLRITKAGTYVASGELNGSITVNCGDSDNVKLVLNGVKITSDDGAAIIVENADKLLITLAADTENELNDADTRDDDAEDIACIYSHDDLTVNGSGSLTVNGNYKNGIEGNDDVKLVNGSITVNAVNNAIKGKDSLYIKDGTLTVKTGEGSQAAEMKSGDDFGDGGGMRRQMPQGEIGEIPSIPEDATDENGNLIDRGGFGGNGEWPQNGERPDIGAGGDFSLPQGGPPEMPDGEMPEMPGGNMPEMPQRPDGDVPQASEGRAPQATSTSLTGSGSVTSIEKADVAPPMTAREAQDDAADESYDVSSGGKGLVSDGEIVIEGGKLVFDTGDDAVHSNGTVTVSGGDITASSGDDGIHADSEVAISGGAVEIAYSYEGIEAEKIAVSGGKISITAKDDGLNAAGGNDGSAEDRQGGFDFGSKVGSIDISGGYVFIDSDGDGLDSNGTVTMSGGILLIYGPADPGNGALDYDKSFTQTGGTLLALGAQGMARNVSDAKVPQLEITAQVDADTVFTLCDKEGNVLFTAKNSKGFQDAVFASTALESGAEYTWYTGGSFSGETENGAAFSGTLSGGDVGGTVKAE